MTAEWNLFDLDTIDTNIMPRSRSFFTNHKSLIFIPISKYGKKVYYPESEVWEIFEIGVDMLIRKQKQNDLANVRLFVRPSAKLLYTITHERVKIIEFVFFVWKMIDIYIRCIILLVKLSDFSLL